MRTTEATENATRNERGESEALGTGGPRVRNLGENRSTIKSRAGLKGLSLSDLARRIGERPDVVCDIAMGARRVTKKIARRMAAELGTRPEALFDLGDYARGEDAEADAYDIRRRMNERGLRKAMDRHDSKGA